jgi:hypothetical protein
MKTQKNDFMLSNQKLEGAVKASAPKKSVQFAAADDFFDSQKAWTSELETAQPKYLKPEERVAASVAPPSSLSRPNYEGIYFCLFIYFLL